ncbi:ATP-binding cassette domain-containing protein [Kutzneria albida]|uniref:ABC transporter domain-containing protein n=1 Tax=Kutzneria albida DSM 43870 TaxID=1449976 RepID=W5W8R9_9PSEU|nr:ATP-binding cassette domain-containing protein [Kutzneria albida]AHH97322.1 hypothetical protein KALB_3958 [Kutzneria albida DSM 43870]
MTSYDPVARLADRWHGWRDGSAGIPLPGRAPLSTPHRDRLTGWACTQYEQERLRYQAIHADYQRRRARALDRLRQAESVLGRARERARELAVQPEDGVLTHRRPGEERRAAPEIRRRRLREHARGLLTARQAVRAARTEVQDSKRELAATQTWLRRQAEGVGERVRVVQARCHRRLASYRSELVRSHPRAGLVAQAMDLLEPTLPEWLREQAGLAEPTPLPPAPDLAPAADQAPRPELDGEIHPIRDGLVIGSCADHADLVVPGYGVAARHAVLTRKGDRTLLRDLGRGSRTCHAGRPARRVHLEPGSDFYLADHRFRVSADGEHLIRTPVDRFGLLVRALSSQVVHGDKVVPELTRVSFAQRAGTVLAILEPTQPGSVALFSALLGESPSSGALHLHGLNMRTHLHQIRTWTGFVPKHPRLRGKWTVRRELEHADRVQRPSDIRPDRSGQLRAPVARVCRLLGLESFVDKRVDQLSKGQRRQLSIAVEALAEPRLLLLDEPISGLGLRMSRPVMSGLREVAALGCTVLMTARSVADLRFADQVVVIGTKGRLVFSGDPAALPGTLGAQDDRGLRKVLARSTGELARKYAAETVCNACGTTETQE